METGDLALRAEEFVTVCPTHGGVRAGRVIVYCV
jgi:hypothetical protein